MSPLISVVIPTYNHEKYISESIQSVLDQTFKDFELIVVNDGSTDKTDEIIRSFNDHRIKYISQSNQGPSKASNTGILAAEGEYVCLLAGDDVYYPEKLEIQYEYLQTYNTKVLFTWIDTIDDCGNMLNGHHIQKHFNVPNRSRTELFNSFFLKGNDLCGVTVMVEKSILVKAGLMHLTSIQMQDFYMWIKLLKSHDFFVVEKNLVKYRIRSSSENLSLSPENIIRTSFEGYQLYKSIFDDVSSDFFRKSFSKHLLNPYFQSKEEYEIEKAFLYINNSFPLVGNSNIFQVIGTELLFHILQNEEILDVASSKYNFELSDLYNITKKTDISNLEKLSQAQIQLSQIQIQLSQTQIKLNESNNQIAMMKNSKVWRLRTKLISIKKCLKNMLCLKLDIFRRTL